MAKKDKGTHNKITKYEMERAHRIKQNQERINSLGLKHLSIFQPKCANVGGKRVSVQVDDDDYEIGRAHVLNSSHNVASRMPSSA